MLISFKVKNYRSIKDEIVLDMRATSDKTLIKKAVFDEGKQSLLKMAAIYGANASGKTNLFKAFAMFRSMILESLAKSTIPGGLPGEFFKLSAETENKPSFFEISFSIEENVFIYGFEIDKQAVVSEWLIEDKGNKVLFDRKLQEIKSNKNYFQEATAELKSQILENALFLTLLASRKGEISGKIIKFFQNTNFVSGNERGITLDYSFGQFLNNPAIAKKQKDLMLMADFGIDDIKAGQKIVAASEIKNIPDQFKELLFKQNSKIAERSLEIYHKKYDAEKKEIGTVPLNFFTEESEGTRQWFALSAPLIDTLEHGKFLFIDEIDTALHPLLCLYLTQLFNSAEKNPKNAQLVFTTHDTSIMKEEIMRRDQIWFTEKNRQGATDLFSLANISERKGVDFAKRYLEGRYGALAFINDLEGIETLEDLESSMNNQE
jgi:hypothetical protein